MASSGAGTNGDGGDGGGGACWQRINKTSFYHDHGSRKYPYPSIHTSRDKKQPGQAGGTVAAPRAAGQPPYPLLRQGPLLP